MRDKFAGRGDEVVLDGEEMPKDDSTVSDYLHRRETREKKSKEKRHISGACRRIERKDEHAEE